MIRWSPGTELANLHGAMDRLFEDFFGPAQTGDGSQRQTMPTYLLPLDVKEVGDGYEIQAAVPGFKPEEVEITFSDGVLRIQAEHSMQSSQQQGGYLRKEVAYGNYQRNIQLPGDVRENDIAASFEDGILSVHVPKVPRPEPKRIQIAGRSQKKEIGAKTS
ncbi:MAG: Hsp20/alpha crystallin family protein [Chloroflexi bacterium]|nr:MAG: Hsp20/alpha crystallin family protein [Chloroflexota bacterium]